jgi:hypothetical protein
VVADRMAHKIPFELAGRAFLTSLIVLEGQGIDVILGMSLMMRHKTVLDISAHLVHLDSSTYGKVSLQLPLVADLKASMHTIIAKSLDEISVVREYPYVFPDDLSGMPPDRAIKFNI